MKKLVLLLLLSSCANDNISVTKEEYNRLKSLPPISEPEYPKFIKNPIPGLSNLFYIVEQDSCEYIYSYTVSINGGPFYTHKGNCKFCERRMDKRFENLYNKLVR